MITLTNYKSRKARASHLKRIITDNCSQFGSLDVDAFHRAILSYRNTIDPVTRFSPALFGRQMRDGMPILPGKYNPHNT